MSYIKKIGEELNIYGDGIASVELWDFSRANLNDEARIEAITQVASVCYHNPNVVGRESLYNRLKAESMGLPSSSFEFVPVLLSSDRYDAIMRFFVASKVTDSLNIYKYGEFIVEGGELYLLTNYRALLADYENMDKTLAMLIDFTQWYNTEEECAIIDKHFNGFLSNIDLVTRSQYIRHRVSWQELSRRYVSGKKLEFNFYISENMKTVYSKFVDETDLSGATYDLTTQKLIDMCVNHYFSALEQGCQPQEARRIIPQAAYTKVWSAWNPAPLQHFFDLRLDEHAQWEIRQLAEAKQRLLSQK